MDDLERQRQLRRFRDEALSAPNCSKCLGRMEPETRDGEPVWRCVECGAEQG